MDRTGFTLFGIEIRWYGVIIASGIVVAFIIGSLLFKKSRYKEQIPYELLFVLVPIGIIGARIYYVIFSPHEFQSFFEVINIRAGGLAIYGGILGGALGLLIYSRIRKCSFFALTDILVICLVIAQAIGRWGNFTNGEAYGYEVGFSFFPITVDIGGVPHLATFFYESMLNLVSFAVLLAIFRRQKTIGTTSAFYFIFYGIIRAVIEPLRTDSLKLFGASDMVFNRVSFVLSLVIIVLGAVLLFACKKGWVSQNNANLIDRTKEQTKEDASNV